MIVTNAGWDAVDAVAFCARWDRRAGSQESVSDHRHADERRFSRTAKSCGPDAPTLASRVLLAQPGSDKTISARRWWQKSPVTGESPT
jgi:hypothetical protein